MPPPWHITTPTLSVRKITVGAYENNVYVVACRRSGDAVIIDAAAEHDRIIDAVSDVTPMAVLTTHGHFDHIGAVDDVTRELDIPFRLHPADEDVAGRPADEPIAAGPIAVGATTIDAVHTPGHTPGSTCFVLDGVVLTGDTLFPGGPGATRFPYSSFATIIDSIATKLFTLDPGTVALPGHGLDTTVGTEQPHLEEWRRRGW